MTVFKYLKIIMLSLFWQLPRAKAIDFRAQPELTRDLNRKVVKRKRLKRNRENLPKIQRKILGHPKFQRTRPKDPRYSDQRKLRRMFRGV